MKHTISLFVSAFFVILALGFSANQADSAVEKSIKVVGPATYGANGPQRFTITIHNALNQVVIYANSELVYSKSTNTDQLLNDEVSITINPGYNHIEVICIKWGPKYHLNFDVTSMGAYGPSNIPSPVNEMGQNSTYGAVVSYQYIINRF